MARPRKFKFGLKPALDKALDRKESCERALVEARKMLAAEEGTLAEIQKNIERTRQQIRSECDKSMSEPVQGARAAQMAGRRRFITELRAREGRLRESAREQEKQVQWAQERVELRREELGEAMQAVDALEKYQEKGEREFKTEQRKREERDADDMTSTRWKK